MVTCGRYAIILTEALTNLSLALVAVCLIVTMVLANLTCTILVMVCVVLVDCDILGLMQVRKLFPHLFHYLRTQTSPTPPLDALR